MPVSRFTTYVLIAALGVGSVVAMAPPSQAADDVVRATTDYAAADRALAGDVLLWEPTYTVGLKRNREIDVLAYRSQGSQATFVGSTYGKRVPSFTVAQKSSATSWAARPVEHPSERLVDTIFIRIGPPGAKRPARARVYANCSRVDRARLTRCEQRDVARFGGALVLLARATTGGVPTATDVRIDSTGVSYQQLVRIARGLRPVN